MPDPTTTPDPAISTHSSAAPAPTAPPVLQPNDDSTPPVFSGGHEQEPTIMASIETPAAGEEKSEITESPPPEIKIPQELKEIIKKAPDENTVKIDKTVALSGVTPAKESTPVITTPTGTIKLPMTFPQALQKSKDTHILDSTHWLAAMIMYEWTKYEPDLVKEQKHNRTTST